MPLFKCKYTEILGVIMSIGTALTFFVSFRRANAIAPNVTPPKALRRWTAALFLAIALSHALMKYGRWLRENFADLEHKEVWQSMVLEIKDRTFILTLTIRPNQVDIAITHNGDAIKESILNIVEDQVEDLHYRHLQNDCHTLKICKEINGLKP